MRAPILAIAMTLAIAGCSSSADTGGPAQTPRASSEVPSSAPTAPSASAPSVSAVPAPTPAAAAITGFGATDAAWEANHAVDALYEAGTAYDPTPGLGPDPTNDDAYYAVLHDGGMVDGYYERVAGGSSIAVARQAALRELPADAKTLWFVSKPTCAQEELISATLGRALGNPAIGDPTGGVFVEFATETSAGDAGYSAKNANELIFGLGDYTKASDAPDC